MHTGKLFPWFFVFVFFFVTPMAQATWSIVAVDPKTNEVGGASATCTPFASAIFSVVPGKGIIVTQAQSNYIARKKGASLLRQGMAPLEVVKSIIDPSFDPRHMDQQHGVVSLEHNGSSAGYTGWNTAKVTGDLQSKWVSVQGNILASNEVLTATMKTFKKLDQDPTKSLADKLLGALEAGSEKGGDRRCGTQTAISAYLVVAKPQDSAATPSLRISIPVQYRYGENAVHLLRRAFNEKKVP